MLHLKMEEETFNTQAVNDNKAQPKFNMEEESLQKDAYLESIKNRLAKAKRTLETIQNLNFKQ